MIDVKTIPILNSSICSLKETSKDDHDGVDRYMTNSVLDVVNFDTVKKQYIEALSTQGLKISESPASNDAFYANNGEMYFIEFKAGTMSKRKTYEVRRKIFDSLLILTDIINVGVSCTRQNLSYILVYNEKKNPLTQAERDELQVSPSRTKIAKYFVGTKGQGNFIRFDLQRFEKLYFKNVFTVTQQEFEDDFVKNWV